MCGIVGIVRMAGSEGIDADLLSRMRDTMAHRGPDGAGLWIDEYGRVGLGHRRLSIIDLSAAAGQPMSSPDNALRIVFNGEIYNHAALRRELQALGHLDWKTDHSDTEVILRAFAEWGVACVSRLRGMFAFCIWDERRQELWLARDRVGIKPLYYSVQPDRFSFASEIKALLEDRGQQRAVDEQGLFHYLSFLTTPAPRTLFEGIFKLSAGCWLRVRRDGIIEERRYWEPWDHVQPLAGVSEAEVTSRMMEVLRTSVQLRKISDVPVGVFLSGGVDSSTNTALFSEGAFDPVCTFSIGYSGNPASHPSELPYARTMARSVNARYHERVLDLDDMLDFLPRMVRLQDEPIADATCVPHYFVSELARSKGVTVCQLGEGADELFCGYEGWNRVIRLQHAIDRFIPRPVAFAGATAWRVGSRGNTMPSERLLRAARDQPVFWGGAEAFTEIQKRRLLSPRLRREFRDLTSWQEIEPIHRRFQQNAWERSPLNWMTFVDLNLRLPELLLMRADKMSMAASVEGRVPFLDHEFIEFVLSIPTAMKVGNGTPKYLLKRAVRGLIPNELIDRPKQGFGVPLADWFRDRLGVQMRETILAFVRKTDYLDEVEVTRVLTEGPAEKVWYLFNLAAWWHAYFG